MISLPLRILANIFLLSERVHYTTVMHRIFFAIYSQQRRPHPPPIVSQRDVVDSQLVDLQSKNDALNEQLAEVLKMEAGLREGIRQMSTNSSNMEGVKAAQEQLETQLIRKNDLLKQISSMEADIIKKEKELKSKK